MWLVNSPRIGDENSDSTEHETHMKEIMYSSANTRECTQWLYNFIIGSYVR